MALCLSGFSGTGGYKFGSVESVSYAILSIANPLFPWVE